MPLPIHCVGECIMFMFLGCSIVPFVCPFVRLSIRSFVCVFVCFFVHSSGQTLLPQYLINCSNSFAKTDREYSLVALVDSGGQRCRHLAISAKLVIVMSDWCRHLANWMKRNAPSMIRAYSIYYMET